MTDLDLKKKSKRKKKSKDKAERAGDDEGLKPSDSSTMGANVDLQTLVTDSTNTLEYEPKPKKRKKDKKIESQGNDTHKQISSDKCSNKGVTSVVTDDHPKSQKRKKDKKRKLISQDSSSIPSTTKENSKTLETNLDKSCTSVAGESNDSKSEEANGKKKKKKQKKEKLTSGVPKSKDSSSIEDKAKDTVSTETNSEETASLDPEVIAMREKKREKRRVKREAKRKQKALQKKQKEEGTNTVPSEEVRNQSLQYIRLWKNTRDTWNFQKVRQVWLLQHMFEQEQVPDPDFAIVLEYLEGLQGKSRQETVKKAESLLGELEGDDDSDEDADADSETEAKLKRVKDIIQLLAE